MFDIGAAEILVIIIVAVVVIGPKEMPRAMRTAGRWIGQIRRVSGHFRAGIDAMVREAELEDMEKKWKAQNEEIMRRTAENATPARSETEMTGPPPIAQDEHRDPMADDPSPDVAPELPLPPSGESKGTRD